jgi:hypothetical protein
MNPGMIFKFYKVPTGENDKQDIINNLQKTYRGALKAGKPLVLFSENKELSPDISPADVSNIDKQQMVLAELCDKKILTGHQLTSPLLAGISVSGQLGGNAELEKSYLIYDNVTIKYDRIEVERFWNRLLQYNKTGVFIEINPFNPFKSSEVKNRVLESLTSIPPLVANEVINQLTVSEIRSLIGLKPTKEDTISQIRQDSKVIPKV